MELDPSELVFVDDLSGPFLDVLDNNGWNDLDNLGLNNQEARAPCGSLVEPETLHNGLEAGPYLHHFNDDNHPSLQDFLGQAGEERKL